MKNFRLPKREHFNSDNDFSDYLNYLIQEVAEFLGKLVMLRFNLKKRKDGKSRKD